MPDVFHRAFDILRRGIAFIDCKFILVQMKALRQIIHNELAHLTYLNFDY